MTGKIEELAKQATKYYSNGQERLFNRDKFAKLIIQECIQLNNQFVGHRITDDLEAAYKEHFGIKI